MLCEALCVVVRLPDLHREAWSDHDFLVVRTALVLCPPPCASQISTHA